MAGERAEAAAQPWVLAAYWFSLNVQASALLTIVVPSMLATLAPLGRTAQLARLAALAAVVTMIVPPAVGALSDRMRRRGVGRRPFVAAGGALNVAGLVWAMRATSLVALAGGVVLAVFGTSVAGAAYQAMMPEVVEPERWGRASGYMAVATLAGSLAGLALAGTTGLRVVFAGMIASGALGVSVTVLGVAERPADAFVGGAKPARVRDWTLFRWIFAARFFVLFAQTLLMTFVLYFFEEVLHVRAAAGGTATVGALALGGAALSAFYAGRASDRRDRALLVAAAGLPMAAAVLAFALFPVPVLVFGFAVVFGLGYGAFISVDWALALDSIPDLANVARDLGVWGIASNLPAVAAPIVGGIVLSRFVPAAVGYRVLFLIAGASFLLGSAMVLAGRRLGLGLGPPVPTAAAAHAGAGRGPGA